MDWKKIKHYLKRAWDFIWNEDSVLSWIVNIVLAFVIIKFLIYPGIGLVLGTNLPVVAVISESMEHRLDPVCKYYDLNNNCLTYYQNTYGICDKTFNYRKSLNFDEYWNTCGGFYENISITKDDFKNFSMPNGFNKGDIIVLRGTNFDNLKVGDILVYQSRLSYPVIHRVVSKSDVIATKGDHNPNSIQTAQLNEKYIMSDQIIGKAWLKIPYVGYVKIWFVEALQCVTLNGCNFN